MICERVIIAQIDTLCFVLPSSKKWTTWTLSVVHRLETATRERIEATGIPENIGGDGNNDGGMG